MASVFERCQWFFLLIVGKIACVLFVANGRPRGTGRLRHIRDGGEKAAAEKAGSRGVGWRGSFAAVMWYGVADLGN